ncbi:MAG: LysR family transcriptional regulator [Anaerovoracaceae bacterium]
MEIQQLRYFLEAAKDCNITKAAKRLHIAQPALSQSIKRLEEEIGAELFTRSGRHIILNDAGKIMVKEITPLLSSLDGLAAKIAAAAGVMNRTVKISVLSASRLVTDIIIAYKELHPDINFLFRQEQTGSVNSADWDVRISTGIPGKLSEGETAALDEEIFLAVPKVWEHIEKDSISVRLRDFGDSPFISFSGAVPFSRLCDEFCHMADISPEIIFKSDNPASVRDLIGAGLGVAFWPAYSWGKLTSDKVRLLHINDIVCRRTIVLSKNPDIAPGSPQDDFYRFILEYTSAMS